MKKVIVWSMLLLVIACKTAKINEQTQHLSTQHVELGLIGVEQSEIISTNFEIISIPVLEEKIRVQVRSTPFTKSTHKAYSKALIGKNVHTPIKYVDSATVKPNFVSLTLFDQIGYIDELNKESNSTVVKYLKNIENVGVTTSISAAFDAVKLKQLIQAEAVYLVNTKHKKYTLEVVEKNKLIYTIALADEVVFGYQLSYFCWGKSKRNEITIVNMRNKKSKCQRATHKNPQKLIKKVNLLKFSK